jgi:O-antigen/teichoic acid export membrane protein
MKKKFLSNLILIVLVNLLIKPIWIFLIDRGVQNSVGEVEYGSFFALFNFTYIFQIILDLGITNYNNKRIAQNTKVLNKYFSGLVSIKMVLGIAYFLIAMGMGWIMDYSSSQFKILLMLCFNQFLLLFILFLRSNISGQLKFKSESFFSVFDKILMILICGCLLYMPTLQDYLSIETFVLAQTVSYLITAIAAWFTALHRQEKVKFKFSKAFLFSTIRNSLPYALLVFLMSIYNKIGPVILERFYDNGKELTGFFAQSYRILDAYMMFSILFINLLYPLFSNLIHKKEPIHNITSMSLRLLFVPTLILLVASYFHGTIIMDVMYTKNSSYSGFLFFITILIALPIICINIFGTLLTANGNLKQLNWISFGSVILNVVLCLLLIEEKGDLSITIALLVSQLFAAIAQIILALRLFKFNDLKVLLKRLILFSILLFSIGYGLQYLNYNWVIQIVLLILFATALSSMLKIISVKEIRQWLTNIESN